MFSLAKYCFSDLPLFPAYLYGNNVTISICDIKSAMLDQNIDSVEAQVSSQYSVPPLNEAAPATGTVPVWANYYVYYFC
ncbi:hypothetical protein EB796_007867 [Bugula neritina]|uniref:Uncharacterized protein n=1 Tax=Bugula neritina TaxID=10212 RepID=A0A7J7JXX1_BUGNE|nr:hypothetical protein EB796_010946 [Bugula neritina]KAF6033830.1 hypothetical protein EB796_007867 [Bugula neritina]